jgi:hypothetical protein
MTVLKRELSKRRAGPVLNDEDWWRLVFDTETKRLYVEHEWEYVDVRRGGKADSGRLEIDLAAFLNESRQGPAQRELLGLISSLFGGGE